ncbi:MAG: cytochrome oxidase [Verrucomicrobiales bacterium]|nr:cytochrome oxidase [Verrucomicrobiales bacterium]
MNFGPFVFIGVFCTMIISWATFVFGPQVQIGGVQPELTVPAGDTYPIYRTGAEKRGLDVYRVNNCAACHTQQVRPAGLGPDLMRGWGMRQRYSVAEDYLYDYPVMLGTQRVGPDLANVGARLDRQIILNHLYDARNERLPGFVRGSVMPPYPFLFKKQKIDRTPSPDALPVVTEAGYEIVPTSDAQALASYVASLRQTVYIFEVPPPASDKPITMRPATNSPATPMPAK